MSSTTAKDDTMGHLKHSVHEVGHDLNDAAHMAGRKVRGIFNSASDDITHAGHQVTEEIRTNPVRSAAIALGIGVLLGALLRR